MSIRTFGLITTVAFFTIGIFTAVLLLNQPEQAVANQAPQGATNTKQIDKSRIAANEQVRNESEPASPSTPASRASMNTAPSSAATSGQSNNESSASSEPEQEPVSSQPRPQTPDRQTESQAEERNTPEPEQNRPSLIRSVLSSIFS